MRSSGETDRQRMLLVRVMMHEPRYHGTPEWPPSPARLFQALVAGVGRGVSLEESAIATFRWLEGLAPPIVCASRASLGQAVSIWVPNNDLDASSPDPANVASIRAGKTVQPRLLAANVGFLYAWSIPPNDEATVHAERIVSFAEHLHQFGRGVDFAWATAAVLDAESADHELDTYPGEILRPGSGDGATVLACPAQGSLDRLLDRFAASARFTTADEGRKTIQLFKQPPMVSFAQIEYGGRTQRQFFELQDPRKMGSLAAWPLARAHDLVVEIRDRAAERLRAALVDQSDTVDAVIVGRATGQGALVPREERVRIVPIPSIGHEHTNHSIRRVLIEIPRGGGIPARDLAWAFAQVELKQNELMLVPATDENMLSRYLGSDIERPCIWRSITPLALPEVASRRRIESSDPEDTKDARERMDENAHAADAVKTALRHAGVRGSPARIRVQREPFQRRGLRAETFAEGTRFPKERLWHVEFEIRSSLRGPMVLGDGRFLGLGLMVPADLSSQVFAFRILAGLAKDAQGPTLTAALRKAVMARYQVLIGNSHPLPAFISGHNPDGTPTRDGTHLGYLYDAPRGRLLIVVVGNLSSRNRHRLQSALANLTDLRAGSAGGLTLEALDFDTSTDPLTEPTKRWRSLTPYTVNRHRDLSDATAAVAADLRASCAAAGLPTPTKITIDAIHSRPGSAMSATAELTFAVAVSGPIMLGSTRFKGGGWFEQSETSTNWHEELK